jgi:hypothetical protein
MANFSQIQQLSTKNGQHVKKQPQMPDKKSILAKKYQHPILYIPISVNILHTRLGTTHFLVLFNGEKYFNIP